MKHLLFYKTLIVILLFVACNKIDLEDPADGTPVFNADLKLEDGTTLTWEAGIDSFYMFTEFKKDALDVYSFSGKMEKETCNPVCKETLTIIIRDTEQTLQGIPKIDRALSQDRYFYFDPNDFDSTTVLDTAFTFDFDLIADTTASGFNPLVSYEWLLGPETISVLNTANLSFDLLNLPNLDVTLRASNSANGDSCVSWQTQYLKINPQDRCAVYIKPNYNVDNILESLEAITIPPDPNLTFEWSTGQSDQEYNLGPFEPFVDVTVQVSNFQNGCTATAGFVPGIYSGEPVSGCLANFVYDGEAQIDINAVPGPTVHDSLQLSTVTIIYQDRSGNSYRSDRQAQNANARFEILNVEDYDDNEKGEPTKKLDLQFSCELWGENGNMITVVDGKAVWGVAYPN